MANSMENSSNTSPNSSNTPPNSSNINKTSSETATNSTLSSEIPNSPQSTTNVEKLGDSQESMEVDEIEEYMLQLEIRNEEIEDTIRSNNEILGKTECYYFLQI